MENLARKIEEICVPEKYVSRENKSGGKKPDLKVVENQELFIAESIKILVSKLREYGRAIDSILKNNDGAAEDLADKIEKYISEMNREEYVSGSSFEHVMNTLAVELCPCAKHFMPESKVEGNKKDEDIIVESFKAVNDYIDLLLKYESFERRELKERNVSLEENCNLSAAQYVAKCKMELEDERV